MRLTKYEHSAMVLEKEGARVVIDPGGFTRPLPDVEGVVAVVVTHEHPDHWTADQLRALKAGSPDALVYGPAGVAAAVARADESLTVVTVEPGDEVEAAPFTLRFFGGRHAVIHSSIPVIDNVGVLVDGTLYYPGDSFHVPEGIDVEALAVPVAAPWSKIAEVMDFVLAVRPRVSTPAHEAVLSEAGRNMAYGRVSDMTQQGGGRFVPLQPGESVELNEPTT